MRKIIIICLAAFALTGCNGEPESRQQAGDFNVGKLFTVDGCTVYRFYDGGRKVYFTNCPGSAETTYQQGKSGTGYTYNTTSRGDR